jgi:hypothetical protein
MCWKAATVDYSSRVELNVFRKRFNIISMQVEQVLIKSNQFKLLQIINYIWLYREGKVTIWVMTKF